MDFILRQVTSDESLLVEFPFKNIIYRSNVVKFEEKHGNSG